MKPHSAIRFRRSFVLAATAMGMVGSLWGQGLASLKTVRPPETPGLEKVVRDRGMLVALGKALFWDLQAGSDGRTACATCHFHAGADHRQQNQLVNSLAPFPVNHAWSPADFPFRLLADPNDNRSAALRDSAAVGGSAGLLRRIFSGVLAGLGPEAGFDASDDPAFSRDGVNTRRVTRRNTPTVINAVFNVRNFWDGRASSIFTGLTPFGESDPRASVLALRGGRLAAERLRLENASLASQAVGPPMNAVEMSYEGRTWPEFGRKMLHLRPLAWQRVAADDSVLGSFAVAEDRGLSAALTYLTMVQAAFQPVYWSADELVDARGNAAGRYARVRRTGAFTQAEYNFALFWGLAVQAYEATLIADDSAFDRFSEGDTAALTAQEQLGLRIFQGAGGCTNCHSGPEFTEASFTGLARRGPVRQRNGAAVDTGFFRIGVRPIAEDLGLAADDDFGRPLSFAVAERGGARSALAGLFKTPTLRNAEFTGPYFHNGGQATLRQVVDFYARGGDFPDGGNLGPGIRQRNLSPADRQALVAFLLALSDDRVRFERAPFDHPELCVPAGHLETSTQHFALDNSDPRFSLSAADRWIAVPPVGRAGQAVPLQTFEELLAGIGVDGSRAHSLTESCSLPDPR